MRLYKSPGGMWHYETERDGKLYWSSLHTRNEDMAKIAYERIKAMLEKSETPEEK